MDLTFGNNVPSILIDHVANISLHHGIVRLAFVSHGTKIKAGKADNGYYEACELIIGFDSLKELSNHLNVYIEQTEGKLKKASGKK